MKQIHIHGKVFSDYDFKNLVIGGQTNADTIRFVLPKIYADEVDFSQEGWTFSITYVNKDGGVDSALLTKSESIQSENIYLDWTPTITATQVAGKLTCQITCTKKSVRDTEISRFTSKPFSIYVDEYLNQTPITPALPTVIEQALELMAEYNADLQNAIEAGKSAEADASAAAASASAALDSQNNAKTSETNAKISETNAKKSEDAALESKISATASASAAAISESNAHNSELAAAGSAGEAADSASSAAVSASNANDSRIAAAESASAAASSASSAEQSKTDAASSASSAAESESSADASSRLAERYAKGTEGGVPVSSGEGYQDNAKYYKDLCYQLSQAYDATALMAELTLMKKRGGSVAGTFVLWAGTSETRPERTLICNGTELTIPTSSADTYWDLYKAIGTTWNTEDTPSGKFAIPDLISRLPMVRHLEISSEWRSQTVMLQRNKLTR